MPGKSNRRRRKARLRGLKNWLAQQERVRREEAIKDKDNKELDRHIFEPRQE